MRRDQATLGPPHSPGLADLINARLSAFRRLGPDWRRSRRGNLTRVYLDYCLTVFERPPGSARFVWSLAGGERVLFTERGVGYATEAEAAEAAMELARELHQDCNTPRRYLPEPSLEEVTS